jgi:hypothetical protein
MTLENPAASRIQPQSLGEDRSILRIAGMDERSQRIDGRQIGKLHLPP